MKKELFFALEKTVYAKDKNVPLHSICSVYGASDEPLKNVLIPLKGEAATVTALDVMARIAPLYPDYAITNLGPTECRVFLQHPPGSPLLKALKVVLLCLVMFFGGAVAIMTFHEDVDMGQVHSNIYAFLRALSRKRCHGQRAVQHRPPWFVDVRAVQASKSRPPCWHDIHNTRTSCADLAAQETGRMGDLLSGITGFSAGIVTGTRARFIALGVFQVGGEPRATEYRAADAGKHRRRRDGRAHAVQFQAARWQARNAVRALQRRIWALSSPAWLK